MDNLNRRLGMHWRAIFWPSQILMAGGVLLLSGRGVPGFSHPQAGAAGTHAGHATAAQSEATPAAQSIAIAPGAIVIMTGEPQLFHLTDDQKRPVRDAAWTVSDPSLIEIKTSGDTATLTGLSRGKIVLTATWKGLATIAKVTIIGDATIAPASAGNNEEWFRITPDLATIVVGEPREFRMVDQNGRTVGDVQWSSSNAELADITQGSDATLTPHATGKVKVTAQGQGHTADANITILAGPNVPQGTIKWSVTELPGFGTTKITPAVPSPSGVDVFVSEADACGRSIIRALTADGLEVWRRQMTPGINPAKPEDKSGFKLGEGVCPKTPPGSHPGRHSSG